MANKKISELTSRTPALSDLMLVGDPSSGYSYKCTVTALATIIETDIADGFVTIGTTQTISGAKTFSNNLTLTSVANATTTQTKFLTLNGSNVVNYRTGAEVLSDIGGASASSISGTTNYVAKFTSSSAIGNSTIQDNGSLVTIGSNTTINTNAPELTLNQGTSSVSIINFKENNSSVNRITSSGAALYFTTNNSATTSLILSSAGTAVFGTIPNATIDTDKFLVSDSGVLKYRTGAEVLSDIGGASAALYVPYTGATTNVNLGTRTITANGVYSTEGAYVANTYGLYGRNAANNAYNLLVGITGQDKVYIDANASGTIIGGALTLSVINNATVDTDTFLVADSGVVKYRTGTQLLSDIGAASSSSISGTTNYIPKFTSSSAIGNSAIYDNGGNIGIGTTGAVVNFQVNGASEVYSALSVAGTRYMQFGADATANYINSYNSVPLIFSTSATTSFSEKMRLTSGGSLGIGTSAPSGLFEVKGDGVSYFTRGTKSILLNPNVVGANTNALIETSTGMALAFGTNGSERMRLDASGNLGINNSSPSYKLDVTGSGRFTGNLGINGVGPTYPLYVRTGTNQRFRIVDGGSGYTQLASLDDAESAYTPIMIGNSWVNINASGNLGLSVTPSAWNAGGKAIEIGMVGSAHWGLDQTSTYRTTNAYWNSGWKYGGTGQAANYAQEAGSHYWSTAPSGTAGNAISFTQAMTLDASGRLGIGTTSPQRVIHGYIATGPVMRLQTNGSNAAAEFIPGATDGTGSIFNWVIGAQYNIGNVFEITPSNAAGSTTFSTPAFVVTSSRNVGIGTTSPTEKLDILGTMNMNGASGTYASIQYNGSTRGYYGTGNAVISGGTTTDFGIAATSNLVFGTGGSLTERMRITSGGRVGIGQTAPGTALSVAGQTESWQLALTSVTGTAGAIIGSPSANVLAFGDWGGTERMRITSGGELLINTTSDAGDYKLQVNGSTLATNYWTPVSASNGYYLLNYNTSNVSSRNWRISNDVDTYGDFGVQVATTQGGSTYTNSLILTSSTATFNGSIKTAAPSGGTAKPWKLGEAGVTLGGSNTSGVRVEIDGVVYYLVTGYLP